MTKAEEIKLLDKTIQTYGSDSYIGLWLAQMRPDILRCMEVDYPIAMLHQPCLNMGKLRGY